MSARRRFPPMLIFLTCVSARESRAWSERKRGEIWSRDPQGTESRPLSRGWHVRQKREKKKSLIVEGGVGPTPLREGNVLLLFCANCGCCLLLLLKGGRAKSHVGKEAKKKPTG